MKTRLIRKRVSEPITNKSNVAAIIISFICWSLVLTMVLFIDPQMFGAVPTFFILTFTALFLTSGIVLKNKRKSALYSSAAILFLALCYFGVGNILNFILIVGIVISIEIFTYSR